MRKIFNFLLLLAIFLVACNQTNSPVSTKEITLKEPPVLTVTVDTKSISAILGTYSWQIDNGDGTGKGVEADSGSPPELVKNQKESLNIKPKSTIVLDFRNKPNDYEVYIWEGNNSISQKVINGTIIAPQQKGLIVYEVHATWKEGNAHYAFSVKVD